MKTTRFFTVILFVTTLLVSCATLPKETVRMSALLEEQIDVLEKNHINLINLYFEEKKLQTKTIVDNKLYPAWLDDFFAEDVVKKRWNNAIEADSIKRMETLKAIVKIVQNEYNVILQRTTEPLERLHTESLAVIQKEYQKARSMNRTIGENISSVQKIQEARSQLLPQNLKNVENVLFQFLEKADAIMNTMQNNQ